MNNVSDGMELDVEEIFVIEFHALNLSREENDKNAWTHGLLSMLS